MTVYGELVGRHGLSSSHRFLLGTVPDGARVLDVGCAEGYLARALAERGCTVVGLEFDPRAAEVARDACERVVVGDVEDADVREQVEGPFDRIVFGDVLEHLRDPEVVLAWAATLLAEREGRAIVSLPNIAHWTARRELLRGRFPQEDHGLFDRTHLRFYTNETARELVARAGLVVEGSGFTYAPAPLQSRFPIIARITPWLSERWPDLFSLQIILICRSAGSAAP